VQPVFAAQCQYGACGTENDPGIVFLMSSVQMDQGEQLKELSGVATTGDTISKKMESYLGNKKLKVNTDSTRKGPGNTTIRPTDELAPTRQLKVIRPELVKNPDSQLVVAFNERLA
ncbi:hypothetical protein DNI00_24925, partial [Salmonella enterica subsp. enterica]|nr:hypothetical protein [Salmonella enterica subsp. enterica serovar Typhimurium]